MRRIVIVGAGQAGARCAEALRGGGYEGELHLVGEELHLPYERPPLSKRLLAGSGQPGADAAQVLDADWFRAHAVTLHLGRRVAAIDRIARTLQLDAGATLGYTDLVLATGARARELALPGADIQRIRTLRTLDDALALRQRLVAGQRLVVIGAGFIGLEVAAAAVRRGLAVTVLEAAAQPMARVVPAEIGQHFAALHRRQGVQLLSGVRPIGIECTDRSIHVRLDDGRRIAADVLVAGVGVWPNDELAASCGLAVDNGIVVDEFACTADPQIHAIGDCARFFHPLLGRHLRLEAWQHANGHAEAAARHLLGSNEPYADIPWTWSDQYDVNLQVTGAPDTWDSVVWRGDLGSGAATLFQLQQGRLVGAVSVDRPRDARLARQLIASGSAVTALQLADLAWKPG